MLGRKLHDQFVTRVQVALISNNASYGYCFFNYTGSLPSEGKNNIITAGNPNT